MIHYDEYLDKCGSRRAAAELALFRSFYSTPERYREFLYSAYYSNKPSSQIINSLNKQERRLYKDFIQSHAQRIKAIEKVLKASATEYILDIGCNVGTFVFHSSKKGAMAYGIDLNYNSLKTAKEILKEYTGGWHLSCQNATALSFKKTSFHKVVAADFYEHLDEKDKIKVTKEVHRVLRCQGIFIIHTDNFYRHTLSLYLRKLIALISLQNPRRLSIPFHETHIGVSTARNLMNIFQQTGFKIVDIIYLPGRFFIDRILVYIPLFKNLVASGFIIIAKKNA